MIDILERLYHVTKANTLHHVETIKKKITGKEQKESFSSDSFENDSFNDNQYARDETRSDFSDKEHSSGNSYDHIPKQVLADLALFNLKPPSSMAEVRSVRNREFKKYHSDRFMNDPERFETSKEIMQIYNAAYDRLKIYFQSR